MYRLKIEAVERSLWGTLLAGFGLMLALMLASGWLSLGALRRMEAGTERLASNYEGTSQLMDQLQRHEADIGVLLFAMAKERGGPAMASYRQSIQEERAGTLRLLEGALQREATPTERRALLQVEDASRQMFEEMQRLVAAGKNDSPELSVRHRHFTASIADLMDTRAASAAAEREAAAKRDERLVTEARQLVVGTLILALVCAAACVFGALLLFHRVERKAEALAQLSIHNLAEQEEAARRFSREMHDEFGQTLNAIESTLAVLPAATPEARARIDDALVLSKEAQGMAREMSQLLRPRILDDLGLDAGLRELASGFSKRTGIAVDYTSNWRARLAPDAETHLFRIAQEALTNVSRHTMAKTVALSLLTTSGALTLRIADDGGGFPDRETQSKSLGLIGMAERARAIGGEISIDSVKGRGVEIQVQLGLAALGRQTVNQREAVQEA